MSQKRGRLFQYPVIYVSNCISVLEFTHQQLRVKFKSLVLKNKLLILKMYQIQTKLIIIILVFLLLNCFCALKTAWTDIAGSPCTEHDKHSARALSSRCNSR